jgi:hypothetical protein
VDDERRLFYVAVPRATHNLVLSYVRQAVRSPVEPSQFLAEMGAGKAEAKTGCRYFVAAQHPAREVSLSSILAAAQAAD